MANSELDSLLLNVTPSSSSSSSGSNTSKSPLLSSLENVAHSAIDATNNINPARELVL